MTIYLTEVATSGGLGRWTGDLDRDLVRLLLRDATEEQQNLVWLAACCRTFNRELLQKLWSHFYEAPFTGDLYQNEDWLRERGEYLYYHLFLRQPDRAAVLTHFLEAHHQISSCHSFFS